MINNTPEICISQNAFFFGKMEVKVLISRFTFDRNFQNLPLKGCRSNYTSESNIAPEKQSLKDDPFLFWEGKL